VFNGSSGVVAEIAAAQVIAALRGNTPANPNDVLGERSPLPNDSSVTGASPSPAQANVTIAKSTSYRVETTINFNDGRRTASEVVIALGDKEEPYRVLSWQDDVEPRPSPRKRIGL
jgi:general secretion pathway protein K